MIYLGLRALLFSVLLLEYGMFFAPSRCRAQSIANLQSQTPFGEGRPLQDAVVPLGSNHGGHTWRNSSADSLGRFDPGRLSAGSLAGDAVYRRESHRGTLMRETALRRVASPRSCVPCTGEDGDRWEWQNARQMTDPDIIGQASRTPEETIWAAALAWLEKL